MKELYGNIKYTVRAVIDRPWAIDYESKKVFTVAAYNNLNLMDGLRVRIK
ncbi:hypothetical protein RI129_012648 [Pyrocoelia pectoralis]|uniref:Arrestin-like N-terminal domain-containing protein n=1 Tax=Pyrocoelia pectoralis TaxID=417401 RepID=A0AAN7UZT4_9COLE